MGGLMEEIAIIVADLCSMLMTQSPSPPQPVTSTGHPAAADAHGTESLGVRFGRHRESSSDKM